MDIKKVLAGLSIASLVGGMTILSGSTGIDKDKVVIAKSG